MRAFLIKRLGRASVKKTLWDEFEQTFAARDAALVERECRLNNEQDQGEPPAIMMPTSETNT
jgi:hypothetical protein